MGGKWFACSLCTLTISVFLCGSNAPAEADVPPAFEVTTITIQVDAKKSNGHAWDAFGGAPDPQGRLTFPDGQSIQIPVHRDAHTVRVSGGGRRIRGGDRVSVMVEDADASRHDVISRGEIRCEEKSEWRVRVGSAVLGFKLEPVLNAGTPSESKLTDLKFRVVVDPKKAGREGWDSSGRPDPMGKVWLPNGRVHTIPVRRDCVIAEFVVSDVRLAKGQTIRVRLVDADASVHDLISEGPIRYGGGAPQKVRVGSAVWHLRAEKPVSAARKPYWLEIRIDGQRPNGLRWDRGGGAPDPQGSITLEGGVRIDIPLHRDTSVLEIRDQRLRLRAGQTLLIDLVDVDVARHDRILKSEVRFTSAEGDRTVRVGPTTVTFHPK